MSGIGAYLEPALIIIVGLALGLVDQTSSEVPGTLRIPALISALILVGQGLSLLEDARAAQTPVEYEPEPEAVPVTSRAAAGPRIVTATDETDTARTPTRAYLVLILAIWLGVATLAYPTAPIQLILLSLLSAYLLFAKGWRTMQTPTQ
jgi:hypothetical protein